ncbi:MAG: BtrH N-terminal domain-containing protein [Legionellales bacterium]
MRHEGIGLSEPMAFGIGAGLFFGHIPFLKISGAPGTTYRTWPGYHIQKCSTPAGYKNTYRTF